MATEPKAANQAFNITNGDLIRWQNLWPKISDYDIVSDMGKARRLGFHDSLDTEEMFLRMFMEFRQNRIIP